MINGVDIHRLRQTRAWLMNTDGFSFLLFGGPGHRKDRIKATIKDITVHVCFGEVEPVFDLEADVYHWYELDALYGFLDGEEIVKIEGVRKHYGDYQPVIDRAVNNLSLMQLRYLDQQ